MSLPHNRLAIKASDGRMAITDWPERTLQSSWRVKGGAAPGCKFGASPDGQVIVVVRGSQCHADAASASQTGSASVSPQSHAFSKRRGTPVATCLHTAVKQGLCWRI